MKLTGDLKKQVEAAATMAEKKDAIENAGMLLDDAELAAVAGGKGGAGWPDIRTMKDDDYAKSENLCKCPVCGGNLNKGENTMTSWTKDCNNCRITWVIPNTRR